MIKNDRQRGVSRKVRLFSSVIGSLFLFGGILLVQQRHIFEPWGLPAIPRNPRPATLPPELFEGKAREAYRIAKEAPELLERMPCYCGCYVSDGHQNNLDCYVDRHAVG